VESKIEKVDRVIADLEKELGIFEKLIADLLINLDRMKAPDFYASYNKNQEELKQQMILWEALQNELELLKNKRN
jgi:hypothetical protein